MMIMSALKLGKIIKCLFNVLVILQFCNALYEDQIGKFDWRQKYIGKLKTAHIDTDTNGAESIILATEHNVIAYVNIKNGEIGWRQVLEKGDNGNINALSNEGEVISVSGNGLFLRSWDTKSGILNWETSLPNIEVLDEHLTRFFVNSEKKEIFAVQIKPKTSVQVTVFRILEGNAKNSPQISAPWINDQTSCDFASGTYMVCAVPSTKSLQLLNLNNGIGFVEVPLKLLGLQTNKVNSDIRIRAIPYQDSSNEPTFALHLGEDGIFLGRIEVSGMKIVKVLPKALEVTSSIVKGQLVLFVVIEDEDKYKVMALNPKDGSEVENLNGEFSLTTDHGTIEKFFILPYLRKDSSTSYKMLVLTSDDALILIHQQGKVIWTREESLASILTTEIWDLPLSDMDVKIEEEFGASDANVVSMLLTRLSMQLLQLQTFLLKTISRLQGEAEISKVTGFGNDLVRDKFGLHKVIVAATQSGKVFGIDNLSGVIIWKKLIPISPLTTTDNKLFYNLFVQRTTAHFPHPAICTLLGKSKIGEETYLHSLNPITGNDVTSKKFDFVAIQAMMLNEMDSNHIKGLVVLDNSLKAHVFPQSAENVFLETKSNHYMFLANASSGTLTGYSFLPSKPGSFEAAQVWKVAFSTEYQQITQIVLKRITEHVHSQGRVMGDRSVLYKYLNPNLAVVVTEGSDPVQKYCLNIYLMDGVTGMIIYSSTHKRARGPVHIVHSENWVVYSYYNEKSRRMEVSSIELYEGKSQSNTSAFSSLSPPQIPIVEHQTFIFPAGVEAMTDTVTEKGITNKHILIALPLGGIVELPKAFLDPRRPIQLLAEHREEGLIPYLPELPITSEGIINYNQTVMQIRGIHTAPSGLESTCLVFAYGLDLYYTRVTPSKTFDILKDDFDHFLISAVLIALLLLSYITRRLAARKALRAAWK